MSHCLDLCSATQPGEIQGVPNVMRRNTHISGRQPGTSEVMLLDLSRTTDNLKGP